MIHHTHPIVAVTDTAAAEMRPEADHGTLAQGPLRVLLVEHNPSAAAAIRASMADTAPARFEMSTVDCLARALALLTQRAAQLAIVDLNLPDSTGVDTVREIRSAAPWVPIVALTDNDDEEVGLAALKAGAQDYLSKGRVTGDLLARVSRYAMERHAAQEALRNSELRLRTILDAQTSSVVHMDTDLNVLWPNKAACEAAALTREEMIGRPCHHSLQDREQACHDCPVLAAIRAGSPQVRQKRDRKGKTWRMLGIPVFDDGGRITSLVEVAEDITERVSLGEQLRQAQKMESLGTLAGGVAHDFNNILAAILGYTELAMNGAGEDEHLTGYLDGVHKAGVRATDLVRQILTFSRRGDTALKPLRIDLIIKEALKLLRSTLPSTINIVQKVPADLDLILADPTQIHQIIMNLCTNASHAMASAGGELSVTLTQEEMGKTHFRRAIDMKPGRYLKLSIGDTGCGMTPEIMAAIFDPYFTTKDLGEGTGLGLAVVHGIVKDYGGDIRVQSEPGKGSRFDLYFPTVTAKTVEHAIEKDGQLRGGSEHILVVDDEPPILKVSQRILEQLGYQVTTEGDSRRALAAFQADPDRYDLVITDLTMPHLTGDRLAEAILSLRPALPIILCTGYSRALEERKAEEMGIQALVMKPVSKHTLATEIRRLLDQDDRSQRPCERPQHSDATALRRRERQSP